LPQKKNNEKTADIMVRIPRALQARYEKLRRKDSWRSFPAFVREAVRASLEKQESIDREMA
jgi:Arc/MetJ-type ribon-helix-helix transcriptional regulator